METEIKLLDGKAFFPLFGGYVTVPLIELEAILEWLEDYSSYLADWVILKNTGFEVAVRYKFHGSETVQVLMLAETGRIARLWINLPTKSQVEQAISYLILCGK